MYNPKDGSFTISVNDFVGNNFAFHFDDTYYIRYYTNKALYAIDQIFEYDDISDFEKVSFHYHIYTDLLFDAIGSINDRFIIKNEKEASKEMFFNVERNNREYDFNDNYPLLHDKTFRNFIEHINEKSEKLIKSKNYYGTFNFIHKKMDNNLINDLQKNNCPQNNYLDLINNTYNIAFYKNDILNKKSISLVELKSELLILNRHANNIWNYLNSCN